MASKKKASAADRREAVRRALAPEHLRGVVPQARWLDHWLKHWLPESVDSRPWAARCGYEPTGIPRYRMVPQPGEPASARDRETCEAWRKYRRERHAIVAARRKMAPLYGDKRAAAEHPSRSIRVVWQQECAAEGCVACRADLRWHRERAPEIWPVEDDAILEGLWGVLPPELIAAYLKRAPTDVTQRSHVLQLQPHEVAFLTADSHGRRVHWDTQGALQALGFPRNGPSHRELARQLRVKKDALFRMEAETRPRTWLARDGDQRSGLIYAPMSVWALLLHLCQRDAPAVCTCQCGCRRPLGSRRGRLCMRCYQRKRRKAM